MSDPHARIKDLPASLRRALARSRPRHWAVLASVGVAALGLASLRSVDLPGPRPVEPHTRLRIEVVPPVEPKVEPGSRMDVGELVDGFRYTPPPPAMVEPANWEAYDDREDWREPPPPPRYERVPRREEAAVFPPLRPEPPEVERRRPRESRWFGFDEPRRDYRAEREERRARAEAYAEARDRRWDGREREWRARRYEDDGPWREPPPPDDRWD